MTSSPALVAPDRSGASSAHVPTITPEQLELVRTTIAKGATDDELRLFLFDCQRQGVHPLDRLIHFTKRSGKYTPITSIDFMRQRAAETKDCGGIDDAIFAGEPKTPSFTATVSVWRLVQGQRCAFTATARWSEYKPEANDFMWQKMPFTMLGKCAEALALRRGFPVQLAGLYAKEELDQDVDRVTGEIREPSPPRRAPDDKKISSPQEKRFWAIASRRHWTKDQVRELLLRKYSVHRADDIRVNVYDRVCQDLETGPATTPSADAAPERSL